jgi:hypothetical protein
MTGRTLVAGLFVFGAVGAASASAQPTASKPASLQLLDTTPVMVRGSGFEARERVSIVLLGGDDVESRVRTTTDAGVFRARFAESLGSCERLTVRAWGSRGSRARLLTPRFQIACRSTSGGGAQASPAH